MAHNENYRQIFEHYRDASQRFEYFVLGVLVALVAYAGQALSPQKIGLNAYSLEIAGLLLIIAAIVLTFKRLEKLIFGLQIHLVLVESRERRGLLAKALIEG